MVLSHRPGREIHRYRREDDSLLRGGGRAPGAHPHRLGIPAVHGGRSAATPVRPARSRARAVVASPQDPPGRARRWSARAGAPARARGGPRPSVRGPGADPGPAGTRASARAGATPDAGALADAHGRALPVPRAATTRSHGRDAVTPAVDSARFAWWRGAVGVLAGALLFNLGRASCARPCRSIFSRCSPRTTGW